MKKYGPLKQMWVLIIVLLFLLAGWLYISRRQDINYQGPPSDHFNGVRFFNQSQTESKSLLDVLIWRITGDHAQWPTEVIPAKNLAVPVATDDQVVVTFVNHASSLIQTGRINILTDPQYNDRASPFSWVGPSRVHEPGVPYEKLPKIDVVIISHDHYDHMDEKTLKMLHKDHNPLFLVGLGNEHHMKSFGIENNVKTLDWWQTFDIEGSKITFVPAQHFSGRWIFDRNSTLWGGYVVQVDSANLFFAGDTGYGQHFKQIREKFGKIDLSMIPIGAYQPRWFMKSMHVNPEDAVKAHIDLESRKSFGIHFKTFQLADEPYEQPVIDLEIAKEKYDIPKGDFVAPEFGQSFIIHKKS